jgi:Amt family ammonium transporter
LFLTSKNLLKMTDSVAVLQQQIIDLQGLTSTLLLQMAEMQSQINTIPENTSRALQQTQFSPGDTAWMLTSTALVLFMTIPGLMLYYSGMVRSKNVLATVMQIFSITCLITVLWLAFGYSLSFGPASPGGGDPVWGNASRFWLVGLNIDSFHQLAPTIPETVFCAYELTFAIITPALICGAFADRMRYVPMLIFIAFWHLLVYCPIAHSVWHPSGFLYKAGVLDYAG